MAAPRAEILAYADRHGAKQAAVRFGVSAGTIRSWRSRARKRAARHAGRPASSPLARFEDEAARLVEWATRGACLRCSGSGWAILPAVTRGGQAIRPERRIPCPDCGSPTRARWTEWPTDQGGVWQDGMARFGDLTANLTGREAAKLLAERPPAPRPDDADLATRPQGGDFGWLRRLAADQAATRMRVAEERRRQREAGS
jgi:hypothetical protein